MTRSRMSGWALLGGLLSLLSGPLPDPFDAQRDVTETPAAEEGATGYSIDGDGFYVWDEDQREAESWAVELAGPAVPKRSA
jgi:hypothetical protein